jgi:hypothetical protein
LRYITPQCLAGLTIISLAPSVDALNIAYAPQHIKSTDREHHINAKLFPSEPIAGNEMSRGITLGQWFREYNTEPVKFTAEDIAWTLVTKQPWPATAELMAHLTKLVEELDLPCCRVKDE